MILDGKEEFKPQRRRKRRVFHESSLRGGRRPTRQSRNWIASLPLVARNDSSDVVSAVLNNDMRKAVDCGGAKVGRKTSIIVLILSLGIFLQGCMNANGKPVPEITFQQFDELRPLVAAVEFGDNSPVIPDSTDIASRLAGDSKNLIRSFVENRIVPSGTVGTLKFTIEETLVEYEEIDMSGAVGQYLWPTRKDRYSISMKVRISYIDDLRRDLKGSVLTFNRSIGIPQSYSLTEKDRAIFETLEQLANDIGESVTVSLRDTLGLL